MKLRKFLEEDLIELLHLFYDSAQCVNSPYYSKEQLDAWTCSVKHIEAWWLSLSKNFSIVALLEHGPIVGFGNIEKNGYLNRLFVHKNYQRQKIGSKIYAELEKNCSCNKITVHSSFGAQSFFKAQGFKTVSLGQALRQAQTIGYFVMEKRL